MCIQSLFDCCGFTSQSIIYIHDLIRPYISNITNRSHALTSQQILCVALRFFANGSFLYNVGDAEHLSKATRAVRKSHQGGVPQDCIDGTHIPITAPSHNEASYVNTYDLNTVKIICDAAHIISNVDAKWPGSVHDTRIYRESNLSNRLWI
ncbi:putative nuclease HARBI1 [Merluccius polli]|uniref:Nuclease HARBI1 n=1 Tax=Merluccius polli TaxID=89951 RepID=A0AA47MM32_MERPO|nr:putative nuclease HARBI1 [Merluccius polli]